MPLSIGFCSPYRFGTPEQICDPFVLFAPYSGEDQWEAIYPTSNGDVIRFMLRRQALDKDGVPGIVLWSLLASGPGLDKRDLGKYGYLRVGGFPLHKDTTAALSNGYQCWSEAPFVGRDSVLLREQFRERLPFGDGEFYHYRQDPGLFHSWSFSYSAIEGVASNPFFGALREDLFYSAFEFNLQAETVGIALEVEGANWDRPKFSTEVVDGEPLSIIGEWLLPEPTAESFLPLSEMTGRWMEMVREREYYPRADFSLSERMVRSKRVTGYTTWYCHYNRISERLLERLVDLVADSTDWEIFQVDDGYQNRIGDWLDPSSGFPNGVKVIAAKAVSRGLIPGIWCAPYIVTENSKLFSLHPEWLLRNGDGTPVLCGKHPLWGGRFYALDSEHPEVRQYLDEVLKTFIQDWGFKFIKADFLYATARIPADGLTRAERAVRAHQYLYEVCIKYGARLLSCGATLGSAYGRSDYSRIGADVSEVWENASEGAVPSREKVSTRSALNNAITRSLLDGAAFGNDPDVIILRSDRQLHGRRVRWMMAEVNNCLGSLLFSSDNPARFGNWQKQVLTQMNHRYPDGPWRVFSITPLHISHPGSVLMVSFVGREECLAVNLSNQTVRNVVPHSSLLIQ